LLRPYGTNRLLGADEVAAAVLLPAGFGALGAEGLFFAEAYGADAIGGDAQGDEILLDGAGAAIAKSEVVFGGAALIAVAFDGTRTPGLLRKNSAVLVSASRASARMSALLKSK